MGQVGLGNDGFSRSSESASQPCIRILVMISLRGIEGVDRDLVLLGEDEDLPVKAKLKFQLTYHWASRRNSSSDMNAQTPFVQDVLGGHREHLEAEAEFRSCS